MASPHNPNLLRDHLANERTFLAWIRTAIAVIGLGFVVAKFAILIREVGGGRVRLGTERFGATAGFLLVIGGVVIVAFALRRFLRTAADLEHDVVRFSPRFDIGLAVVVGVVALILAVYLVLTS